MINSTNSVTYSTTKLLIKERPQYDKNQSDPTLAQIILPTREGCKGEGGLRFDGYCKYSYERQDDQWVAYAAGSFGNKTATFPISTDYDRIPLITLITVVFNGAEFLEETIQSIINQTYINIEYIVIDGGSTDGTLDIIKKYENAIDYWASEKDRGIYDAMNKGLALATGEFINFMNAGDVLIDCRIIENNLDKFLANELIAFSFKEFFVSDIKKINCRNILAKPKMYDLPTAHNAIFFPYDNSIRYKLNYQVSADYDYYLQYQKRGYKVNVFKEIYMRYLIGGVSERLILRMLNEKRIIYLSHNKCDVRFICYWLSLYAKIAFTSSIKIFLPQIFILKIKNLRGFKQ